MRTEIIGADNSNESINFLLICPLSTCFNQWFEHDIIRI